jgi:hypothetical protein
LFAQKQILGRDGSRGRGTQLYKGQCVQKNGKDGPNSVQKRLHGSILLSR